MEAIHVARDVRTDLWCGTRTLLMPPSLALIFRQRLDRVWGEVFTTFFTWTHWVAMPSRVSPTRFTSAVRGGGHSTSVEKQDQKKYVFTFTF